MTFPAKCLLVLMPVIASEITAKWWTTPPPQATPLPVLTLRPPAAADWRVHGDVYREVQPALRCSSGWISDVIEPDGPGLRVAYFAWDETSTLNTLEAFKHPPEQCMGSIGMKLEKIHSPRRFRADHQTLVFDSTVFRPHAGGLSVHVFKCVWVEGLESPDLRDGNVWGDNGLELRRLRLAAATTRFKPRHTRVIMGAVAGMPSEELAWHRFSTTVLGHLAWSGDPAAATVPPTPPSPPR